MRKRILAAPAIMLFNLVFAQNSDTLQSGSSPDSIKTSILQEVTVTGKKPFIQLLPDKVIVNVDAAVTNTGATVLEVLEKSPGITVDRNGNISLKGKRGVVIMIDGKPAQLSGTDLNNMLSGITANQVDQIEIMDNPPSRYDAAGNAGIINIKTKKNRQHGFNGNASVALGQGKFSRTINSINLNHYSGKINLFANVNVNLNRNFLRMYAARNYYADDNSTLVAQLEQPSYLRGRAPSQSVKTGVDYFITKKTTVGTVVSFTNFSRRTTGSNNAVWMDNAGNKDSLIVTTSDLADRLKSFSANLNARHVFNNAREITADVDYLGYRINNDLLFNNRLTGTEGYEEDVKGLIPSSINIITAKSDYSQTFTGGVRFEGGWKSSHIETDNKAEYFLTSGAQTIPDYGKTNHFLYKENIHAAYANAERKGDVISLQTGLRYETTNYNAQQLGNEVRKDSSFSRAYSGLFPTVSITWQIDSLSSLSVSAGRRIDRPRFQSLNPFVFVINKYTYESGNPFIIPQYTWNSELTYSFKNMISASLAYSYTKDYFSQIFLQDSTGIITYTQGNLDNMKNIGLSVNSQLSPVPWWSLSFTGYVNYKTIEGFVWNRRKASLTQASFNMNNQLTFSKGWSAELSGVYQLREQELQEITEPTGQLSLGVAKQVLKNKGTIRLAVRDIFYTQAMEGFTDFEQATEYFKIKRDTRAVTISFNYRFGRQAKTAPPRKTGGADEEINRVNATG